MIAQLRRGHALAITESDQSTVQDGQSSIPALSAVLLRVMQQVSERLNGKGKQLVLVDGLDEAFGPTGRYKQIALPGVMPRQLPQGIVVILTSRPGEHLDWLADQSLCRTLPLDAGEQSNQDDIEDYLRDQNTTRALGLDDNLIQHLADASEGYMAAAVRYILSRDTLEADLRKWQEQSDSIPRGLHVWIREEWKRIISTPPEDESIPTAKWKQIVTAILGLMACAREPLSPNQLRRYLRFIADDSDTVFDLAPAGHGDACPRGQMSLGVF